MIFLEKYYNRKGEEVRYDKQTRLFIDKFCKIEAVEDKVVADYIEAIDKELANLKGENVQRIESKNAVFMELMLKAGVMKQSMNIQKIKYYEELRKRVQPNTITLLFEDDED